MLKKDIIVKIEPRHFAASVGWSHVRNNKCPLFNALKELFPNKDIVVGASGVFIDHTTEQEHRYTIINWGVMNKEGDYVAKVGETDWPKEKIDKLAKQAAISLDNIPTVSVTLKY